MVIDVLERDDLPFPRSLPEFQRRFPDEAACAAYLERARWGDGFVSVETDETYVGGHTRGKGRDVHNMVPVAGAVEVKQRKHGERLNKRRTGRYAGRVQLAVVPDRSAKSLGGFIEQTVKPGGAIITDDWGGYAKLGERGYCHSAIAP